MIKIMGFQNLFTSAKTETNFMLTRLYNMQPTVCCKLQTTKGNQISKMVIYRKNYKIAVLISKGYAVAI